MNFHRLSFGSIKEANGDPNVVSEAQLTLHMALCALAGVRMHQFRVFRGAAISRGAVTRGMTGLRSAVALGGAACQLRTLAARAVAEVAVHEDSAACRRGRPAESSWTQALDMSPCEAEHHWPCNWKHNQRERIDASVAPPPRRGSGALGPTSSCSAF